MNPMTVLLAVLATVALIAALVQLPIDGYRRIPTAPVLRRREDDPGR